MERSGRTIKIATAIIFIALAVYIIAGVITGGQNSLRTVTVTGMSMNDSIMTEGWCVRDEEYMLSPEGGATVTIDEGAKIARGEAVAISYNSQSDLRRAEEIRSLTVRIDVLEASKTVKNPAEAAKAGVRTVAHMASTGDLSDLDTALYDLDLYLFGDGEVDTASVDAEINEAKLRIQGLQSKAGGRGIIYAEKSGTFSSNTDGLEGITPDILTGALTPSEVRDMFTHPARVPDSAFGKISRGIRWYYVTLVDSKWASRLTGIGKITVKFTRSYSDTVDMTVQSIGQAEDGKCVLVLSSDRYLQAVAGVRELIGEIILSNESGVRVPKEAVHLNDNGEPIVYVIKKLQASEVKVTILGEEGSWYMVDGGSALRPGNEVITRAPNLYDGAVVLD
ncbi:MAG: hypothetical protein II881_09645 [Oscillospiraceae bacterium]|nr:hypothetical protein [Oscillospiraceae bacterium]